MSKHYPDAECECPVGTTASLKGRWWGEACSEAVLLTSSCEGTDTVWKPELSDSTSQRYGHELVGRQFMGNVTTLGGYRLDERQSLHNANRAVYAECSVKLTLQEPDIRKLATSQSKFWYLKCLKSDGINYFDSPKCKSENKGSLGEQVWERWRNY